MVEAFPRRYDAALDARANARSCREPDVLEVRGIGAKRSQGRVPLGPLHRTGRNRGRRESRPRNRAYGLG
jgi:hypothetical protein